MKLTNKKPTKVSQAEQGLLDELRGLIDAGRITAAQAINSTLTTLYWQIGQRIRSTVLNDERAEYGQQIVATLSRQLVPLYGQGFTAKSLARMIQFSEVFPNFEIVATLSRQLSWSHFRELLPLKQPLEREYYAEMCKLEQWSVRTLRERIGSQLYLRTALAKKPEALIEAEIGALRQSGKMTPDLVFRDPYILDFLGLADGYNERDLEAAILRDMERFLIELGVGFTFVARQKRMSIGGSDFYLDLLFYHRFLRCLVAVELKLEPFSPSHKGQMELYLRWLDKNDRAEGEAAPLGLILCASADSEQVELMDMESASIRVAEYRAQMPDLALLQNQLQRAVGHARERAAQRQIGDEPDE